MHGVATGFTPTTKCACVIMNYRTYARVASRALIRQRMRIAHSELEHFTNILHHEQTS